MDTACLVNGQRQTITLNYEIYTLRETKTRDEPSKDFPTLNVTGTGHVA